MDNLTGINELAGAVNVLQSERAKKTKRTFNTAVILHLYYVDLWSEISAYLANLGSDFDLYVSICGNANAMIVEHIKSTYPNAFVCKMKNKGRDIGPFMEIYPAVARHYEYICKIHSKKSLHLGDGSTWRQEIYSSILGTTETVERIKEIFDTFPKIGIIAPKGQLLRCQSNVDSNTKSIVEISKRLNVINPDMFDFEFVAGSMFWFRSKALNFLLSLNITQESFCEEQGQTDNTLAHALERIFTLASITVGYEVVDTQTIEIYQDLLKKSGFEIRGEEALQALLWQLVQKIRLDKATIVSLDKKNIEMEKSYSWRITQPLRFIMRNIILKTWLKRYFFSKRAR